MDDYQEFIAQKLQFHEAKGIDPHGMDSLHLFPHQYALTRWSLRKGRSAIFADTGLGKTRMQLVWADTIYKKMGVDILILCPLAVAEQTVAEGLAIGIDVNHARDAVDIKPGINITNYDRLHRFDPERFGAIVLDESSIIKHHDAKTFKRLTEAFKETPYKLCATATPAPNDWMELGTHAEFLGICTQSEMLAEFFVHDAAKTQDWRLKGHARDVFWRWVSSWGVMIRSPADLGYDSSAYELPPLTVEQITVESDAFVKRGELFISEALTLTDRRQARRDSLKYRVSAVAEKVNSSDRPWIIWCDLNIEGESLCKAIPDAIEVKGADTPEHKEQSLKDFASGKIRVLVTKPKIAGFGLNWQHCSNIGFVGVTDSWESYYQAIRRCWRFGQKREVVAYIFASKQEGAVRANLERKEKDALVMLDALSQETRSAVLDEVIGNQRQSDIYHASKDIQLPIFLKEVV